jgi:exopolyphosphatase/guanosine-5'-triphosphate,3'-diphosphate pyrophosphatase
VRPIPYVAEPEGRVIGYVDIGTNSIRLLVVRLTRRGSYTVLSDQKETVRLGEGEFRTGNLTPEAMDRAVLVATRFTALARSFGAEDLVAVATSATREAHNRDILLSRLRSEAGLDVHVVSGEEEARLIFLGVTGGLHLGERTVLVIDIGGGSTEIAAGTAVGHTHLASIKLGSIRLGSLFPAQGPDGAYTRANYQELREYCASSLLRPLEGVVGERFDLVLGSSGTIQTLASVAGCRSAVGTAGDARVLSADDLRSTARTLASLGVERRRRLPGMNPGRAEIIVPGAAILEAVFEALALDGLTTTPRGLKEGLLLDHLTRCGYLRPHGAVPVREQSVARLAENCHSAVAHAEHVADLAGQLFDSAGALGLHRLDGEARELLLYSARLHDVGTSISFSDHHLHSQYILTRSELLGFDERERAIMGLIVRLHRKKLPGPSAPELREVLPDERGPVLVLALFLRLAEALDRTHCGLVRTAVFEDDGDGVRLVLGSAADPHLEVWGAGNQARAFRKVFGRRLTLEVRAG